MSESQTLALPPELQALEKAIEMGPDGLLLSKAVMADWRRRCHAIPKAGREQVAAVLVAMAVKQYRFAHQKSTQVVDQLGELAGILLNDAQRARDLIDTEVRGRVANATGLGATGGATSLGAGLAPPKGKR